MGWLRRLRSPPDMSGTFSVPAAARPQGTAGRTYVRRRSISEADLALGSDSIGLGRVRREPEGWMAMCTQQVAALRNTAGAARTGSQTIWRQIPHSSDSASWSSGDTAVLSPQRPAVAIDNVTGTTYAPSIYEVRLGFPLCHFLGINLVQKKSSATPATRATTRPTSSPNLVLALPPMLALPLPISVMRTVPRASRSVYRREGIGIIIILEMLRPSYNDIKALVQVRPSYSTRICRCNTLVQTSTCVYEVVGFSL
jgi:hypothetical protein